MTATITGNQKKIIRVQTGFHSLDRAFINDQGEIGVPIGIGYEIFGLSGIGKSTFTFSLAGLLGRELKKNIVIAALEDFDSSFLLRLMNSVDYSGNIHVLDGKRDEDILYGVVDYLHKSDYAMGIVDSLGAISPISEQEGDIGEANMGRRAMAVAQFTRKCLPLLRPDESIKTVFLLNHYYPMIGSRGYTTPAGEVKKFITTVRILLKRQEEFPDGSYVLKGEIKKNRWGYEDREFYVFMLVGRGLHKGLSAMWDGIMTGKVSRKTVIKIDGENLGRISEIVKKAKSGDEEFFTPFYEVLKGEMPNEEPKEEENEEGTEGDAEEE